MTLTEAPLLDAGCSTRVGVTTVWSSTSAAGEPGCAGLNGPTSMTGKDCWAKATEAERDKDSRNAPRKAVV